MEDLRDWQREYLEIRDYVDGTLCHDDGVVVVAQSDFYGVDGHAVDGEA